MTTSADETVSCFVQGTLEGLARPLAQTEFVVLDLETTGGSPASAAITELAAIRTRGDATQHGGREFATLVNPGRAIPPHVAALTGITDALVAAAPRIEEVLPRFFEFAAGAVLVAHNAPFDIGFLTAACGAHNLSWPRLPTLDTAGLARRMLTTDEVPDCRLGTLAEFFGADARPRHRALDDARAATAVLHGLIGLLAERGVHTVEALRGFAQPPASQQRRMLQLTAGIPRRPGVCLFMTADGQVLHVVRSSDMHARACGYFAAAETRLAIREMVDKTARIVPVACATTLEAEVTEIRLIALHRPPYGDGKSDRRGGHTAPPDSRVSRDSPEPGDASFAGAVTREADRPDAAAPKDDADIGDRSNGGDRRGTGSRIAMGGAVTGGADLTPGTEVSALAAAMTALAAVPLLVAARPRFSGGWDVTWIRYGRLDRTAVIPRGAGAAACAVTSDPEFAIRHADAGHAEPGQPSAAPPSAAHASAAPPSARHPQVGHSEPGHLSAGYIDAGHTGTGCPDTGDECAGQAETRCLVGWLESPGVRLIRVEGTWCCTIAR